MNHYAVVFFPKIDLEKIQKFRKEYDPMSVILDPHITLVFPYSSILRDRAILHFTEVAKNTKPFDVRLHGFTKSFDHVLFLLVDDGKENVFLLHDKLYSGIFASHLRQDVPFIPHMTLGKFSSENGTLEQEHYNNALQEAKLLDLDIFCHFDNFSLIEGDGIKPAKILRTFTLQ